MTIATFKIACEVNPHAVNIRNWRYMTGCLFRYGAGGTTHGTRIITPDNLIEIMGYKPKMIREVIADNTHMIDVVFAPNNYIHPGYCDKCEGRGKVDWIRAVTGPSPNNSAYLAEKYASTFIKKPGRLLVYKDKSRRLGYDFTRLFSRVEIEDERAEKLCKHCYGTGLHLDGRRVIFSGMPGLRHMLKEFEWNEKDLPG